jgi:hypothetical protein
MILIAVARETAFTAQIPGIAQIMCSDRVLCFLNYLKKSDRSSTGLVSGLRAIPPEGGRQRRATCFAFALSSFLREAAHGHASCLACAHFPKTQVLMLGPKVFGLELWGATPSRVSWCTTARLQRQEYRLRRKRPPPIRRAGRCPPFKSSTLGLPGALAFPPFLRRVRTATHVPVLERKIAPWAAHFSLQNGIQKISPERRGRPKCDGPTRPAVGLGDYINGKCSMWNIPSI